MTEDPRLYLSARRPGGQDDADPAIAAALAAAQENPAMAAWVDEQAKCDNALACKLREVQPPPGLRERLVAGCKVSRPGWRSWFERKAWRSFRNGELLAAAAVVLLLGIALAAQYFSGGKEAKTWQEAGALEVAAIESAGSTDPLDHVVSDLPAIRNWLTEQTCPSPATLPGPVQKLPVFGCAKRTWRGQTLSIVCFSFGEGKEVHLVTIDRKHLPAAPPENAPQFATVNGYQTASWSEGTVAMMLIGKVRRDELEGLFHHSPTASRQDELISFESI